MKGSPMFRKFAPHVAITLAVLGLGFLVASVWTIGQAELSVTLGLAATGLACFVLEWRIQ